jgi:hypothetical protein
LVGEQLTVISMTRFYAPPKFSRQILMPIAGIFLIAATQAALAKNGDHSGDQGDMHSDKHKSKSGEMYSQNGDQNSHKHKDKGGEMYSQNGDQNSHKHKDKGEAKYSEKHKDKSKQYAEKGMGKDKHKTPGNSIASNNPPAPGTGGTNTIHPIPSPVPVASSSGAPAALCVTPPVNTIHPIPSPAPVASSSGGPVAAPVDTIVRDHRHPPAVAGGPQPGVKPDGYTPFEDSTAGGHFWKGVGDFADGLAHGFSAGPAPEDPTGTYTQY